MFVEDLLSRYERSLVEHVQKAAMFLTKCQLIEPWVSEGRLYGCVSPWELGKWLGAYEDFHDTLEAIWVWAVYRYLTGDSAFDHNMRAAVTYVTKNYDRFLNTSSPAFMYDASHVLHTSYVLEALLGDASLQDIAKQIVDSLLKYVLNLSSLQGRAYDDPWWAIACLLRYCKYHGYSDVVNELRRLVISQVERQQENFFTNVQDEPAYIGPGGHDFFCHNSNRVLALYEALSCYNDNLLKHMLEIFASKVPTGFVKRHADENAWNAHLATGIALAFRVTKNNRLLKVYDNIMRELEVRSQDFAISRSPDVPLKESWATYFYVQAHVALVLGIW